MRGTCNRFFLLAFPRYFCLKLLPFPDSLLIYSEPSRCSLTILSLGACDNLQLKGHNILKAPLSRTPALFN